MKRLNSAVLPRMMLALVFVFNQGCGDSSDDDAAEVDPYVTPDATSVVVKIGAVTAALTASSDFNLKKSADAEAEADDVAVAAETKADSEADIAACAATLGVTAEMISVVGNKAALTIDAKNVLLLKVNGNKAVVTAKIEAEKPGDELAGFCLIVAGNKTNVTVNVGATIKGFSYEGRGNKAKGTVAFADLATAASGKVAMKGNKTSFTIVGAGEVDCAKIAATQSGNNTEYACTP